MDIRLIWLAVGTFAIGVESFAISSLLPQIAESTGVSLTQAGYLVLAFALANAFGSPVLAALTGTADRRRDADHHGAGVFGGARRGQACRTAILT